MMDEISKSIAAQLHERSGSPLIGTFVLPRAASAELDSFHDFNFPFRFANALQQVVCGIVVCGDYR